MGMHLVREMKKYGHIRVANAMALVGYSRPVQAAETITIAFSHLPTGRGGDSVLLSMFEPKPRDEQPSPARQSSPAPEDDSSIPF
jgi:hypothetical protein